MRWLWCAMLPRVVVIDAITHDGRQTHQATEFSHRAFLNKEPFASAYAKIVDEVRNVYSSTVRSIK